MHASISQAISACRIKTRPFVHKASGIALITVMIVVASVSATASWLLYSQNLDTTRMARVLEKEQAVLLALSFEKIAMDILKEDRTEQGEQGYDYYASLARQSVSTDTNDDLYAYDTAETKDEQEDEHENQSWSDSAQLAEKISPLVEKFETLGIKNTKLCIYDLQAMLNINNMLRGGQVDRIPGIDKEKVDNSYFDVDENPRGRADWYTQRFRELYSRKDIGLDESEVAEFLDNIRDWLDDNDDYRPKGAESADYSFEKPAYRAANGPIASIQELYLIKVFKEFPLKSSGNLDTGDFELGMDKILTYIVALPTDAPNSIRININNASPAVLATLPYIDRSTADELYSKIREEPLRNRGAVGNLLKDYIQNDKRRQWHKEYIDVQSRFFAAYIELGIGKGGSQTKTRMHSLFYREALAAPYKVYVLERHYIGYNPYEMMANEMGLDNCYSNEKHSSDRQVPVSEIENNL